MSVRNGAVLQAVRAKRPLVYCLTNGVTINDCANILLGAGAAPVMSCDPREAAELARAADAVVINFGTPSAGDVEAMLAAGRSANAAGVPVLLDPVGVGATALRSGIAAQLIAEVRFAVIRGNASEIRALGGAVFDGRGVDAAASCDDLALEQAMAQLIRTTGAVIAASGPVDRIGSGADRTRIFNGSPWMERVTGTGCMESALLGAFLGAAAETPYRAAVDGMAAMAVAGEIAAESLLPGEGNASYRLRLLDAVSLLDETLLAERMRYEEK